MSLSKQLYFIVSIIFIMIFVGNFVISVKNTKEYLQTESITKAQDTAVSLGMSLRNLLEDKRNAEIETVISAIANSGFYKEIRLEDAFFSVYEEDLIIASKDLDEGNTWKISDLKVDAKYGRVEKVKEEDLEITKELSKLENEPIKLPIMKEDDIYHFIPTSEYKNGGNIPFTFKAINENGKKINGNATLDISKILVQVSRDEQFESVPSWFINLISFDLKEQFSEINNDWQKTAVIFVSANAGEAYAKLYEEMKSILIYSAFAFLISMILLYVFVQYLLKPLKNLENLANDISVGKFGKILELPWTKEIKNVALAFNDMSIKIEAITNKLNNKLVDYTKKLSQDELTALPLKHSFEIEMKNMFIHKSSGYILVVNIFDLHSFAKTHTTQEVNEFIKKFAEILKTTKIDEKNELKAFRFWGSQFALVAKNYNEESIKKLIETLKNAFNKLGNNYNKKDVAHIGVTIFNEFSNSNEILQKAHEAYEKATLIGPNEAFINDTQDLAKDMQSWRELICDVIDNSKFELNYIGNYHTFDDNQTLILQEAFANVKDEKDNDLPIGTFVCIAEKFEKVIDFDKKVISKVIDNILKNHTKYEIVVNLSLESINNTAFIAWLEKKIQENRAISKQLVFCATAYAVAKDIEKFKFFANEIHKFGSKVIIKRFESKFIALENLKDLNLDYIRLARDYTCNICNDTSKKDFIESIQELSTLLNIKVLAENVTENSDFESLKNFGLFAVSR